MQKLILIAFNAKIGMKLILDCYRINFSKYFNVYVLTDKEYAKGVNDPKIFGISESGSHIRMALDVFNIFKMIKIMAIIAREKKVFIYFISAHPLNAMTAFAVRIINLLPDMELRLVSHIHDVTPHANTKNGFFIDAFQTTQVNLSDHITVYGDYLKSSAKRHFSLPDSKIFSYLHGVNRTISRDNLPQSKVGKKFVSLIGRIDKYKGIDIFLDIIATLEDKIDCEFLLAGYGDLSPYTEKIKKLKRLNVVNQFLSDDEMDEMLLSSHVLVLPYIDASQSGMIPVAYYNACPVIVSDVGGLPEMVKHGETGFISPAKDVSVFTKYVELLVTDSDLRNSLSKNSFEFYRHCLQWDKIINDVAYYIKSL
ncbi:glycosyltransferase family 4 protein [Anabaena sp. FACHB-1391]|uniref:glycosyltransferase family 4 protein n=1 Tax=Anabaena sp. FACHB-1391 TaxID=2692771 RepID=UPI001680B897|nr:glycosyltransferase family 4 protein [Anabaena sp. FACHB-1391]MBD2268998.1 glycosyltransferase family 4 protein [Anabaena sp. FACHB-1391]